MRLNPVIPVSRPLLAGLATLVLSIVSFCWLAVAGNDAQAAPPKHDVHVGWLLGSPRVAAVAIDVSGADKQGNRAVVAYVCDGLGEPDGLAAWFKGSIGPSGTATLTSRRGTETLEIQFFDEKFGANGVFTEADGRHTRFDASPAQGGAGIYDVTLDSDLRYSGVSTEGAVLDAQADHQGKVEGTIRRRGERVRFKLTALAFLTEAELEALGLPTSFPQYLPQALVPGDYVAVITHGSRFWMGRSGDIRGGAPGPAIIGLDYGRR